VTAAGRPSATGEEAGEADAGTSWLSDGRMVAHQVRYEQIAFWRNRIGAIFTVGFSVVFVVLLGTSAGTSRVAYLGNIRLIQYYVPGFVAYGVMAACFNTLCITLVVRRETGLLKRLRLSPLPTWALLSAIFVSTAVVAMIEVALTLAIGRIAFHVHLPQEAGAFLLTLLVGVVSFTALGVAMSTFVPNQEAAGPVTSVVFFVLLFLSGLWFPLHASSGLAQFSSWFPLRRFIVAVFLSFDSQRGVSPWAWSDLLVVAAWGLAAVVIAARRFRWSPHRG
jgi:ABC-2 type transport system permease protein